MGAEGTGVASEAAGSPGWEMELVKLETKSDNPPVAAETEERPAEAEVRFSRNSSGELLRAEPLWSSCWGGKEAAMLR